jgi:hypothetical protein
MQQEQYLQEVWHFLVDRLCVYIYIYIYIYVEYLSWGSAVRVPSYPLLYQTDFDELPNHMKTSVNMNVNKGQQMGRCFFRGWITWLGFYFASFWILDSLINTALGRYFHYKTDSLADEKIRLNINREREMAWGCPCLRNRERGPNLTAAQMQNSRTLRMIVSAV